MGWPLTSLKESTDKSQTSQPGIHVNHWFWASMRKLAPKMEEPGHGVVDEDIWKKAKDSVDFGKYDDPYAVVMDVYKKMGGTLKSSEADTSTAFPQVTRESNRLKEKSAFSFRVRVLEKSKAPNNSTNKFRVVLLEEGLGNLGDCYYYTKDSLMSAVPVFEGKKIYLDHPDKIEEETRPERSVKDVAGHYENVSVQESDGRSQLQGDLVIVSSPAFERERALMEHAVQYAEKYPDKNFVGLSINANGDAEEQDINAFIKSGSVPEGAMDKMEEAIAQGISSVKVVKEIASAVSCDLVTEAGAGGKALSMIEKNKKENQMDKKNLKENEEMKQDGEHDDEQQDVALIKKMLDEYLGADGHNEEDMKQAKQALDIAKKNGMKDEDAMKCVGHSMKMAKMMHAYQAESEDGETEEEEKKEGECEEGDGEGMEKKESAEILRLKGKVAALQEAVSKHEVASHLEDILKESKLPMAITKKFREAIKGTKSKKEIDEKFKLFTEGYELANAGREFGESFFVQTEKAHTADAGESFSLADCAN